MEGMRKEDRVWSARPEKTEEKRKQPRFRIMARRVKQVMIGSSSFCQMQRLTHFACSIGYQQLRSPTQLHGTSFARSNCFRNRASPITGRSWICSSKKCKLKHFTA